MNIKKKLNNTISCILTACFAFMVIVGCKMGGTILIYVTTSELINSERLSSSVDHHHKRSSSHSFAAQIIDQNYSES